MKNPVVSRIVGVVAGLVVAMLVVMAVEGAGHAMFPPPEGLDITRPEDQAQLMELIPLGAKIAVVVAWFLGALAGAAYPAGLDRRAGDGRAQPRHHADVSASRVDDRCCGDPADCRSIGGQAARLEPPDNLALHFPI